jgi:hypothetical protein
MADFGGLIQSATYVGIGGVFGPLIVAMIQSRGKKSESRATAADLISNAAGGVADRLNTLNIQQGKTIDEHERTIKAQRLAMIKIIDVLDDVIDSIGSLDGPQEAKLREANRLAREAAL